MADESAIIDGTYRGIRIRIASGSVTGGRKVSIKRFPGRDTNAIEDLGGVPRSYRLEIIVSDLQGQDYFSYRDSLIAALEQKGPAILEHPLYGRIENVVCTTFSFNENFSEFGRTIVSASFEIDENTGIPQQTITALSQITAAQTAVISAVNNDVADNFSVTTKFTNNFGTAVDKVNAIVDSAKSATSFVGDAATDINQISAIIGELSSNVNSLITAPQSLADAIENVFSNINGLIGTVENTAKTMAAFFGFGDDAAVLAKTTAGRTERANNDVILNAAVNIPALSYAYTNTAQSAFETVEQIDVAANELETQYQRVIQSDFNQAAKDALTDQRVITQQFFDEQRLTLRQVIDVFTPTTSVRLLSYQYYAESESGEDIALLNNVADVSFIEDDVRILTA